MSRIGWQQLQLGLQQTHMGTRQRLKVAGNSSTRLAANAHGQSQMSQNWLATVCNQSTQKRISLRLACNSAHASTHQRLDLARSKCTPGLQQMYNKAYQSISSAGSNCTNVNTHIKDLSIVYDRNERIGLPKVPKETSERLDLTCRPAHRHVTLILACSKRVCMCASTHACTRTHTHIHKPAYTHIHKPAYTHTYTNHIHTHTHMHQRLSQQQVSSSKFTKKLVKQLALQQMWDFEVSAQAKSKSQLSLQQYTNPLIKDSAWLATMQKPTRHSLSFQWCIKPTH